MRILSIHVLHKRPQKSIFLKTVYALDFVAYLKRKFVRESLNFAARTTVTKIHKGEMIRVEMEEQPDTFIYAHINDKNIGTVIIADKDYPESAALKILLEVENKFLAMYTPNLLEQYSEDQDMKFPELDAMIQKYQDPKEADKLIKIEQDLGEIQHALHKTMNDLMDRGEKLDDLLKQSEDISGLAYNFYSKAKESNQKCCSLY